MKMPENEEALSTHLVCLFEFDCFYIVSRVKEKGSSGKRFELTKYLAYTFFFL